MLTNLRRLRLRLIYNGFHGPWTQGIVQNMTNLRDLVLSYNEFNISLPLEIATVKSLSTLSFAGNKLYGKIPQEYTNLSELSEYLSLFMFHFLFKLPKYTKPCLHFMYF